MRSFFSNWYRKVGNKHWHFFFWWYLWFFLCHFHWQDLRSQWYYCVINLPKILNRSTQVLPGYCDSCLSFPQGHLYQGFNVGLYKFRPVVLIFVNECVISIYCYGHPVYDMVLIEALPMGQCCRYISSIKTLK